MKKNRLFALLCAGALSASMLTACGGSQDSSANNASSDASTDSTETAEDTTSLKYIQDKGTLVLGLDDQLPPMGFLDESGTIVGFDIDVAEKVCEKLGVELVTQPINWDSKQMELDTKNIDCIWNGLSWSEERDEAMTLSIPYLENHMVLVVPTDSSYQTMDDLAGKNIALQSGSTAQEAFDAEPKLKDNTTMIGMDNNMSCLLDAESGASDAALMDETVANYLIETGGRDLRVMGDFLYAENYVIGFRKGETQLADAVNNALVELKADGTLAEISTKWFGSDITTVEAPAENADSAA